MKHKTVVFIKNILLHTLKVDNILIETDAARYELFTHIQRHSFKSCHNLTNKLHTECHSGVEAAFKLKCFVWCRVVMRTDKAVIFITLCYIQTGGFTFPHGLLQLPVNREINISSFRRDTHTARVKITVKFEKCG